MIYITYGAEWQLALMKMTKKELVDMIRRVCLERDKLEEENKKLEERRDELLIESGCGNLSRGRL